jgi:hypothetical protein
MACAHEDFEARVEVNRLHEEGGDDPHTFLAEITVRCTECGQQFGWRGVRPGLSFDEPAVSVDGLTLSVPMRSPAEMDWLGILPGLKFDQVPPRVPRGFKVRAHGPEG